MNRTPPLIAAAILAGIVLSEAAPAAETVTIGAGGEFDWAGGGSAVVATIPARHRSLLESDDLLEGNAPGALLDFDSQDHPGAILPLRIAPGENVAHGTLERGGEITAPNVFDFSGTFKPLDLKQALEELITPGGELEAFERKNLNSLGILVILNLGGRFGVERIRFYPRNTVQIAPATPFQNDFLRSFELYTNDGLALTQAGLPIWGEPVAAEEENKEPVVDVRLDPPRYVQHIRLRSKSTISYEIDEFEVFGTGFLATATYVSDIFDAGQPAVWHQLRWTEKVLGDPRFSAVSIRTRTGTDADPFVFTRTLHGQADPEEIPLSVEDPSLELSLEEYKKLPVFDAQGQQWNAGPVKDDLVNWSPFSTPFDAEVANTPGALITSPSPRRYMQFQIAFESSDLEAARVIESLSYDVLRSPLADSLTAEVFPREVDEIRAVPFTLAVRARFESDDLLGFDRLEIRTPLRVSAIDEVRILDGEGQPVSGRTFSSLADTLDEGGFRIVEVSEDRFEVGFPPIARDGTEVRIDFRSDVLTYSTDFAGSAKLSPADGVGEPAIQPLVGGDTGQLAPGDEAALSGTTVLSPTLLGGRLLGQVELLPNPFSPNGDGFNDAMSVSYSLLSLEAPRQVELKVYDLGGRLVRVVSQGMESNGRYEDKAWDGTDDAGQLVPPGLYLFRVAVEGDHRNDEVHRLVAVVY